MVYQFFDSQFEMLDAMPPKAQERGKNWLDEEVFVLIAAWSDDVIQGELGGSQRNRHVYEKIAAVLKKNSYDRTGEQCKEKIKKLKKDYKAVVDNNNITGNKRRVQIF